MAKGPYIPQLTHAERRARRAAIVEFIKQGGLVADACKKFGVGYESVKKACCEHGVACPKVRAIETHQMPVRTYEVIAALFGDETMTEIGKRFGVSFQRIQKIYTACRQAGIPVKERKVGTGTRKE